LKLRHGQMLYLKLKVQRIRFLFPAEVNFSPVTQDWEIRKMKKLERQTCNLQIFKMAHIPTQGNKDKDKTSIFWQSQGKTSICWQSQDKTSIFWQSQAARLAIKGSLWFLIFRKPCTKTILLYFLKARNRTAFFLHIALLSSAQCPGSEQLLWLLHK
jgi:hypothetical protein